MWKWLQTMCYLSPERKDIQAVPWYETNSFWGAGSMFLTVVFVVVAAMQHDFRWMLLLAWPFGGATAWTVLRGLGLWRWLIVPCTVLIGISLFYLNTWLNPNIKEAGVPPRPTALLTGPEKPTQTPPKKHKERNHRETQRTLSPKQNRHRISSPTDQISINFLTKSFRR